MPKNSSIIDKNPYFINEQGQTLLFVLLTMAIALAVGVGVSVRTLSSLQRTSTTDTSARVLAAAEGGAENFLSKSIGELSSLSADPNNETTITFNPVSGDSITAQARVSVEELSDLSEYTIANVEKDRSVVINLEGYTGGSLQICWSSLAAGKAADMYYSAYSVGLSPDDFDVQRGGVRDRSCTSGSCYPPAHQSTAFTLGSSDSSGEYDNCYSVSSLPGGGATVLKGIRIKSLVSDSEVEIRASGSSTLPVQGYKIHSLGELTDSSSGVKAQKTVLVTKTLPYLPDAFDYGFYTENGSLY